MSPQSRRGRAVPPSHRKPASRVPSEAVRKPVTNPAGEETVAEVVASAGSASASSGGTPAKASGKPVSVDRHPAALGRRRRGPASVRSTSVPRNIYRYVKAYVPLIVAFVVLFGAVWAWTSWGPHAPTPQENWTRIENASIQKRDAARQEVSNSPNDFAAQLNGYKAYRDATRSWMKDLAAVSDWSDSKKTTAENTTANADVKQLIQAGTAQADLLDTVVAATSPSDVLGIGDQIVQSEQTFNNSYFVARVDIMGPVTNTATEKPTLALPSGNLAPSDSQLASPAASALAPSGSPAPAGSPSAS